MPHSPPPLGPVGREPEQPSTRALLALLPTDPDRAWQGLLQRTRGRLSILLSFRMDRRLRAMADEEDVLQDVWVEAMGAMERFQYRGPGSLQRWFAGILRNKLKELSRNGERRQFGKQRSALSSSPAGRRLLEGLATGVSHDARQKELEDRVREVLAGLPEREREALLMRIYEGLTVREAARIAKVDPAAMSRRTSRALARCAARLKGFT